MTEAVPDSHLFTTLFSSARAFCVGFILTSLVPAHGQTDRPTNEKSTPADRKIECVAPAKAKAINLTVNGAKTRFRLHRGVTSFVIPLSAPDQRRCFTLENEIIAANGTFSIATANERLAVNDANWNIVGGAVRFRQKKQFYLSLMGVEAKFVRLTFQIEDPGKIVQRD
jgi:hypothetical protein